MPDVLRCQLPGCGKALVGRQQKYCSRQHKLRARNVRLNATPTGFVCKAPGCGVALMGQQKKYCVVHRRYGSILAIRAFVQSERAKRLYKNWGTTRRATGHDAIRTRRRYRGMLVADSVDLTDPEVRARLDRKIRERDKLAGLGRRLKHGPLLECPRCHSYKTKRHGSHTHGQQIGECDHCQRRWTIGKDYARVACVHCGSEHTQRRGYNESGTAIVKCMTCLRRWTIGKDYAPLPCVRCGSKDTKRAGYYKSGAARGECKTCLRRWTIGKDYGTPFPPAIVDLLHTARQTTLTPEEEEQVADILGSAHAEPACDAAHIV